MEVLGLSGSPKVGGNTDRMVQALLERSGKQTEFVNLSELHFDPCRGCCHLCAATNECGIEDDILPYLKMVVEAEALVLGTPFYLGMPTGFMFNFLTRLECFHHVKILLHQKPVVLVSVGCKTKHEQEEEGIRSFEKLVTFGDHFTSLGHIYFNAMAPPCLNCGEGVNCRNGGLWKFIVEEDEERLNSMNISSELTLRWEDIHQIQDEIRSCAALLAKV